MYCAHFYAALHLHVAFPFVPAACQALASHCAHFYASSYLYVAFPFVPAACQASASDCATSMRLHTCMLRFLSYRQLAKPQLASRIVLDLSYQLHTSHNCNTQLSQLKVKIMLRPTVQSATLSWNKAPMWGFRPDHYSYQTVAGLLMWGAFADERTGLSFARLSQQQYVSCQYVQFTCYKLLNVCIYNICKASVSPGSVQQIMPYH
jgi:hypothetical protein